MIEFMFLTSADSRLKPSLMKHLTEKMPLKCQNPTMATQQQVIQNLRREERVGNSVKPGEWRFSFLH